MDEMPTDSETEAPGAEIERQGLTALTVSQMSRTQREEVKREVIAAHYRGLSWARLEKRFPLIPGGTMKRWYRESTWEAVDTSPEAVAEYRTRQAFEVRAMIYETLDRIEQLKADQLAAELAYEDKATARIETDTDRFSKLINTLDKLQNREAKLLGLDAAMKVEHSGRINVDFNPELETLVAELAGGGMLFSQPDEIEEGEWHD